MNKCLVEPLVLLLLLATLIRKAPLFFIPPIHFMPTWWPSFPSTFLGLCAVHLPLFFHHGARTQTNPPVPSTPNALKRQFFSHTRSVLQNIPRSTINTLENNHIYLSLFDAIRDLFGHGGDVEFLFTGSHSVHSNTP
jgi:hypothetical protein